MPPTCTVIFTNERVTGDEAVGLARRLIEEGIKELSDDEPTPFLDDETLALSDDETTVSHDGILPDFTYFVTNSDNAELIVSYDDHSPYNISNPDSQYSAHFRIPPTTLCGVSEKECIKRAQRFAVGSLAYTVMTGNKPFSDLDSALAQHNLEKGIYPEDTMEYPLDVAVQILGLWSQEFAVQFNDYISQYGKSSINILDPFWPF